jgi:hypothetical protein
MIAANTIKPALLMRACWPRRVTAARFDGISARALDSLALSPAPDAPLTLSERRLAEKPIERFHPIDRARKSS